MNDLSAVLRGEPGLRERFLIINAGRTGSSLLCAVLAAAGAEFGMPSEQRWNAEDGAFEQPAITRAGEWFAAARQLSATKPLWPRRWGWDFARHRAKLHLKRALETARFVKGPNLDFAVQPTAKFGYCPKIIVNFRLFTAQALSLAQRSAHRDATSLEADYLRTYKNALMWLLTYGGCVVDYDELVDVRQTEWATALASVTGLSREALLEARESRLDPDELRGAALPALSRDCAWIYTSLRELSGRIVPPSPVASRSPALRIAQEAV